MNATILETKMIKDIAESDYNGRNGGKPQTRREAYTWTSEVVRTAQDKGVFTSLLKKGLIAHNGESCELTTEGFNVYQTL